MVPANAFLSECDHEQVFCLANPGKEYIVYMVRGQSFKLNLSHSKGTLEACWYNPRNGEYMAAKDIYIIQSTGEFPHTNEGDRGWYRMHKAHNIGFSAPDHENDWVLYLKEKKNNV